VPDLAKSYDLTNYDAAYLELAIRRKLRLQRRITAPLAERIICLGDSDHRPLA
jgi:hypothetical protein